MNLKNEFDFFSEWFLNTSNFSLIEITITDIVNLIDVSECHIFPVKYSTIDEYVFYFLKKDNFSNDFFDLLKNNIRIAKENIESIILKNIFVKFFEFAELKDILKKIEKKGLILRFLYDSQYEFILFIPYFFLEKILKNIFKYNKSLSILESFRKIKDSLYKSDIIFYWDIKDFINILSNKSVQILINTLLKNNMVEETMLSALIAGTGDNWQNNKIYINLSKNMKSEINNILSNSYPDKRWIDEVLLIVKSNIHNILENEIIKIDKMDYVIKLKEKIKRDRYNKIFKEKPFDIWIKEIFDKGLIDKLRNTAGRNLLMKSISDYPEEFLDFFYNGLSKNAKEEYKADFYYFKKNSSIDDIYNAKIFVVEKIKDIYYSEESRNIKYFYDIIEELSGVELEILIMEIGITKFAQATLTANKEFKRNVSFKLSGALRNLMVDIYNGKIRFKSGFGDATINRLKQEIIKTYLYLKDIMLL